jgi:hypothetical protein
MLDRLGNAQPGFANGNSLSERSHLSKAQGQIGPAPHGGKDELTQALVTLLAFQQGHGLPVGVHALTIVPLEEVHQPQEVVRLDGRVGIVTPRARSTPQRCARKLFAPMGV